MRENSINKLFLMGSLLFEKLDYNYILTPILILEMDSTL